MKVGALDAALAASALTLAALIAAGVLLDPELVYTGGISTSAANLGYGAGVSAEALRTGYLAGFSTSAKRLGYALRCFIYVNNSWYALRLKAKLEDGTPIRVTAKVNGTSYEVPEAGLLLNWTREEPVCAYVDPIAYVEFPSSANSYALKGVEGAEQGVASWPPFTTKEVVAVYSAPGAGAPSQPGQQPQPGGGAPSTAQQPTTPVEEWVGRILWWLAWAIQSIAKWLASLWPWWLLLLLLALAAPLAYLWWSRKRFAIIIEVKG